MMIQGSEVKNGRSCKRCSHFAVCSIIEHVAMLMQKYDENTKPFDLADIGKICKYFKDIYEKEDLR